MSVFRSRTVVAIVLVGGASFLLAIVLAIFGPDFEPRRSIAPDAYSYSALGHRGLVEALRTAGLDVLVSRHGSAGKAGERGILVLAEPTHHRDAGSEDGNRLRNLVDSEPLTLLVLPKRRGVRDPKRPGWIRHATPRALGAVEAMLEDAGIEATLRRVVPIGVEPIASRIGPKPTFLEANVQVLDGEDLTPLVTSADGGMLFAHVDTHPGLFVLADPDPISNAGVLRGENAAFVLALLEHIHDGFEVVVFDETIHGHVYQPSIWRAMFEFPLVLVGLHVLLVFAVLLWAAMGRFGRPQIATEPLQPGRVFLVDRSADLLRAGGGTTRALPRYLDVMIRDVRRALDLPPTLRDDELDDALDRIGRSRQVGDRIGDLRHAVRRAAGHRLLAHGVAQRIHRWRTEILHGDQ